MFVRQGSLNITDYEISEVPDMVEKFIYENFDKCTRSHREDMGELIGLPYPYTVPSISGGFQEMYYWDTYFTNVGLILSGRTEQAKNNVDNIIYLTDKYGYMPNGNLTRYLKSSQPPFLSLMVRDIYDRTGDSDWLKTAAAALEKEYNFWCVRRSTACGLNRYGVNREKPGCEGMDAELSKRLGINPPIETAELKIEHFIASCESGWDLTPRFEFEAFNYAPIDLNCLLYALESNMAYFCGETGAANAGEWQKRAETRAELMRRLMKNADGCFYDCNFNKNRLSPVFSAASLFPLFVGMATAAEAAAAVKALPRLEKKYGVAACEKNNIPGNYQWDYPNGWACLQFIAAEGLLKYGYTEDARRIAEKYITATDGIFAETGNLWEKYNVIDGTINTRNEYKLPPMLGWTAGTYLYMKRLLGTAEPQRAMHP